MNLLCSFITILRNDLTKDQELDVLINPESSSEGLGKSRASNGLYFVFFVLQCNLHELLDCLLVDLGFFSWNDDLFQFLSEIVYPEIAKVGNNIEEQNDETKREEEIVVRQLLIGIILQV